MKESKYKVRSWKEGRSGKEGKKGGRERKKKKLRRKKGRERKGNCEVVDMLISLWQLFHNVYILSNHQAVHFNIHLSIITQ